MTLPKPEAVIFDWDNTLVNTWPIIHHALNETFEHVGLPVWTIETTMRRVKKSMRDSFPEIFGADWQAAGEFYQARYRALHLDKLEALEEAENVLKHLQAVDVPMLVVSNKKGPNLRTEVNHLGWQDYFASVVGAGDAGRDKPYGDPALLALSHLEMQPSDTIWFLGDSDVDLACAQAVGCTPILYGPVASTHPEYCPEAYFGFPYRHHAHDHFAVLQLLNDI